MNEELKEIITALQSIANSLRQLVSYVVSMPEGISVVFSKPQPKEDSMVVPKITPVVKSAAKPVSSKKAAPAVFTMLDNEDDSFTVMGVDAGGNPVDISSVATLTVTSDTPTIATVSSPVGMTSEVTAVGPTGSLNLICVATWNNGSIGPFTITQPVTISGGPAVGLTVEFETPTVV